MKLKIKIGIIICVILILIPSIAFSINMDSRPKYEVLRAIFIPINQVGDCFD